MVLHSKSMSSCTYLVVLMVKEFRQDIITLQNPHGLPPSSALSGVIPSKVDSQPVDSKTTAAAAKSTSAALKSKEAIPCTSAL